jgi:hypothetical protein
MFLYFKTPHETNPLGQINMRDTRVEEMPASDSDSEENEEQTENTKLTIAIHPQNQGPTYLIFTDKQERDNWLYHLTIVSGGGLNSGTQFEQLVQKLMEADGDQNSVLWRHPILLYSKENITSPLTSLNSEELQNEAVKLFKVCRSKIIKKCLLVLIIIFIFRAVNSFCQWQSINRASIITLC